MASFWRRKGLSIRPPVNVLLFIYRPVFSMYSMLVRVGNRAQHIILREFHSVGVDLSEGA